MQNGFWLGPTPSCVANPDFQAGVLAGSSTFVEESSRTTPNAN
jgi:hypothetical protein